MANKYLLKRSSVSGKSPTTDDLDYGELALNYNDGLLYFKDSSNQIKTIGDIARAIQLDSDNSIEFDDSGETPIINFKIDGETVFSLSSNGASLTTPLDMNDNRITDLGTPTLGTDAATRAFAEDVAEFPLFPTGDYGSVAASGSTDAFGVPLEGSTVNYDMMEPSGEVVSVDFEALS